MGNLQGITNMLYSSIINYVKGNSNRINDDKIYLHASTIMEICPRYIYYVKTKKSEIQLDRKPQGITVGLAMTFGIGIATERLLIDSIALNKQVETLFLYKCSKCGRTIISTNKNIKCDKCGSSMEQNQLYIEHEITKDILINGHPDLLMRIVNDEDTFFTYEIKTINPTDFDNLKQPLLNHIYQLKTYLYLIKLLPVSIRKKYKLEYKNGYIVYIKKTFDNQPIKIFEVKLDTQFKNYMEDLINQIKNSIETGIAPRRCCNSKSSVLAKKCPFRLYCFRNTK